jgi:hypothetical protein
MLQVLLCLMMSCWFSKETNCANCRFLEFGCENLASNSVDWFIVLDKHKFQVIDFFCNSFLN